METIKYLTVDFNIVEVLTMTGGNVVMEGMFYSYDKDWEEGFDSDGKKVVDLIPKGTDYKLTTDEEWKKNRYKEMEENNETCSPNWDYKNEVEELCLVHIPMDLFLDIQIQNLKRKEDYYKLTKGFHGVHYTSSNDFKSYGKGYLYEDGKRVEVNSYLVTTMVTDTERG